MAFVGTPQCGYGVGQARTPVYSKGRPKASRSCNHECASLEQPLAHFRRNEQKGIARARRHAFLEWDKL
jgi:hypothetical protein